MCPQNVIEFWIWNCGWPFVCIFGEMRKNLKWIDTKYVKKSTHFFIKRWDCPLYFVKIYLSIYQPSKQDKMTPMYPNVRFPMLHLQRFMIRCTKWSDLYNIPPILYSDSWDIYLALLLGILKSLTQTPDKKIKIFVSTYLFSKPSFDKNLPK